MRMARSGRTLTRGYAKTKACVAATQTFPLSFVEFLWGVLPLGSPNHEYASGQSMKCLALMEAYICRRLLID